MMLVMVTSPILSVRISPAPRPLSQLVIAARLEGTANYFASFAEHQSLLPPFLS
jgi:hypothetical protein